ncbi:Very-long-chain (3R)-3-hydroxyacyl-CoA dehydratase [Ascochyta rabiei]|uniref:Very-long-chain (3R)-3-hydroxyacyl-CoA dehydratase n=1 Tax=Didymella rabiei TaxID=5454 RepID=UPI0022059CFC|nr:Very-long-chain (3R)-3-hydroxyacyl-CoA dehydratase [Ascochyta rabiei]UPX21352.1 Very-long-chain (3R)-3-hydroxyacyl-CoA dehydratase [Ascochyta rabiei]
MTRSGQTTHLDTRGSTASWSQPRTLYLTAYNLLFAALWVSVGISAANHAPRGKFILFEAVEPRARWIQTLTLIEVVHAAVGMVKSPVSTTATQVFTRVIQVWMIWYSFPASTAASRAFMVLVLAWSVADSIRYLYLALNLHGKAPQALIWLRYTMFYPLYPIGIGAEWWLMYKSIEPLGRISPVLPPVFYFLLALYVPGAYTMFTYMVKQRKKILSRGQKTVKPIE